MSYEGAPTKRRQVNQLGHQKLPRKHIASQPIKVALTFGLDFPA